MEIFVILFHMMPCSNYDKQYILIVFSSLKDRASEAILPINIKKQMLAELDPEATVFHSLNLITILLNIRKENFLMRFHTI